MIRILSAILTMLLICSVGFAAEAPKLVPPMDRLYENRLQAESSDYLAIWLYDVALDPAGLKDPKHFAITSPDDPDYAQGVSPVASGSRTRQIRVSMRKELLTSQTAVFLKLPKPMKNGRQYTLKASGIELPEVGPLLFDDQRQINDNLRVNQLGYLPALSKYAYVGQYMGDLGPMPLAATEFQLIGAKGGVVFTGPITRRDVSNDLVGQIVYQLDFSSFQTPGTYRIRVPGVGLSYAFVIGPDALNPAFVNIMRGHYHQRCGQAIDVELSRSPRVACHLDDAFLEERVESLKFVAPKSPPLYPQKYDGQFHSAIHGHHDAGDYGKYTITGASYVFSALMAYELFPEKLSADNLASPSSGNGIPDIVDEAKWELDWLENMQSDDGAVFGVIKPNTGGYEHTMPPAKAHRLFYPKDTVFTGAYAAALAHASRSPIIRKHYPQDADRYLQKAQKAWAWLSSNDRFVEYFHYGAVFGDWDERCWAAAELYAATGERQYHDYFLKNFRPDEKRWGWWGMFDAVGNAVAAYTFLDGRDRDPQMLEKCRAAIRDACKAHLSDTDHNPYRLSIPQASVDYKNYGWYFPGDLAGWDLLLGYALDKKREYVQCAFDNMSYTFGANPFGYFLHTGLGSKRNIEVVSDYANNDNVIEPIPGIPLGIGSPGFYWLDRYDKKLGAGTYPEEWPLLNRWYDGFNVQSEFTMGPMMRETIVTAFFADLASAKGTRPSVAIKADKLAGPAPLDVAFSIESNLAPDAIRQVFWDFGDETFSIQPAPVHRFADAGRSYPVAVTIIDHDGYWATHSVSVNCTVANAPYPQEPSKPDASTVLLYHLDGDLKDASGKLPELTVTRKVPEREDFRFAKDPPTWMQSPSGSCLVLDGAEHFSVELPPDLIADPAATPITLDMMLYLQEFTGWGYEGNPLLLGLKNDWDSWLGWLQETWDKSNAPKFGNIPGERFAKEFPRNRWTHVTIAYNGKDKSTFSVDGKQWGEIAGQAFKPTVKRPLVFSFGPFRGMVDEVRVTRGQ